MKVFFLDTNILLQCKDLKELPWNEIQTEGSLLLVLPRPVQIELDRLKSDGNSRRAKRARKASKFLREIIQSEDSITDVRVSNPKVQLKIVPNLYGKTKLPDILDLDSPDDRILAEMIAYKEQHPDDEVAILTQDINLLTTAKHLTLPFFPIPDDWLLPPESDVRDKTIAELEHQLKIHQSTQPQIEIIAYDGDDDRKSIDSMLLEVSCYKNLDDEKLEELVAIAKAKHPVVTTFNDDSAKEALLKLTLTSSKVLGIKKRYEPPKMEEIENYHSEKYPEWLKAVENYFQSLRYYLEQPRRVVDIMFSINNIGIVPVEDLVVEFTIYGGALFVPPEYDFDHINKKALSFPKPPTPPEGYLIEEDNSPFAALRRSIPDHIQTSIKDISNMNFNSIYHPDISVRDKNGFYWEDGKPTDHRNKWVFECEEFLHHVGPEDFPIRFLIPIDNHENDKFNIKYRVAAKNLPQTIERNLPISVKFKCKNLFDIAKSYIE